MGIKGKPLPPNPERAERLRALVADRREKIKVYRTGQAEAKEASRALAAAAMEILRDTKATVRAVAVEAGITEQELRTMLHRYYPDDIRALRGPPQEEP